MSIRAKGDILEGSTSGISGKAILCWAVILTTVASSASGMVDRFVHRRDGLDPVAIERASASEDGLRVVRIDRGLDREEIIPWDQVAAIDPRSDGVGLEVGLERWLEIGDRLWRGRIRLRRGDARLAGEAFQQAMDGKPSMDGGTAPVVIEGLVAAAIADGRSADVLAEAAFLGELALAGRRSDRFLGAAYGGGVVDAAWALVPSVPPILGGGSASVDVRRRLRTFPELDAAAALRRDLWLRLLDGKGAPVDVPERGLDPGTRFLADLANLDAADASTRERVRRRLLEDLDEAPTWRIAWIRHRVGRSSIVHAEDEAARIRGVLDLVHVLALEDAAPASLRLDAARMAAATLRTLNRVEEAELIDSMLLIEFPDQKPTENAS